uniref:MJ0042-type zinc finger domain-containing protein n=1 Tax=Pseudomonas sp. TaxID=306 RepID=UPI003563BF75
MTESFVTQCPHCRTSFRVNLIQLGAARGAVRCGACLHVFNAAQQLLEQDQRLPETAPPPGPSTPAASAPAAATPLHNKPGQPVPQGKSDSDTLWIHDDLDLDSLDLDEELAKLEEQEQQLSQQFLALNQTPEHPAPFHPAPDTETQAHDEDWAEALLHDDSPGAPLSTTPVTPGDAPPALTPSHESPGTTPPDTAAQAPSDDLAPFKLGALDTDHRQPGRHEPSLSARRDDLDSDPDDLDTQDEQQPDSDTPHRPGRKAPRSEPGLRDEHLFELDDEPLQLDWQPARKPWGRWLGWGLLNLLAATALI